MKKIYTLLFAVTLLFPFFNLNAQVDSCEFNQVNVILTTGQWASEMSWDLTDDAGNIVASGGNYADNSTYSSQFCLPDGCYTFNLEDTFGDGWNGGEIAVEYNGILVDFPLFLTGNSASYPFGINDPDCGTAIVLGCTDPTAQNWDPQATIDDGSCVYDSLFTCVSGWIEGAPAGLIIYIYSGNNIYTAITNADGWFNQQIPFGETVQFGTFEDCNGNLTDILFEFNWSCWNSFSPPYCDVISGCTDPIALNYNPDASVDDGSCIYPDSCDFNSITGITVYGGFPSETSWSISDEDGFVVYSSSPYANETTVVDNICLEDGCYLFEAFDSFGDGWNGATFQAIDDAGNVLIDYSLSNGEYGIFNFSVNDTSCVNDILGCTDSLALNFNPLATIDDGTCTYPIDTIYGCTDPIALNYNFLANIDDGSCLYDSVACVDFWVAGAPDGLEFIITTSAGVFTAYSENDGMFFFEIPAEVPESVITIEYVDCFGELIVFQAFSGGPFFTSCFSIDTQWCQEILGCTDSLATNYNPWANIDDGSCIYPIECDSGLVAAELYVCVFANGQEVGISVVSDDGSIVYEQNGFPSGAIEYIDLCIDPEACYTVNMWNNTAPNGWYNGYYWINALGTQVSTGELDYGLSEDSNIFSLDGSCGEIFGCTDPIALNYNPDATTDDGSCEYDSTCNEHEMLIQLHVVDNVWLPIIELTDPDGNIIFSGTIWTDDYSDVFCVPAGCYNLAVLSVGAGNTGSAIVDVYVDGVLTQVVFDITGDPINYAIGVDTIGCQTEIFGCTDPDASNYDSDATIDDGSCEYDCDPGYVSAELYVCTFQLGNEVGFSLTDSDGNVVFYQDGFSDLEIAYFDICLDPTECYTATMWNNEGPFGWYGGYYWVNLNSGAQIAYGSLDAGNDEETLDFSVNGDCGEIYGCTDPMASNYNPDATIDNGSCQYPVTNDLCADASPLSEGTITMSNIGAYQNEGMDGDCWGFGNGEPEQTSVWFEFTTPTVPAAVNIVSSSDGSYSLTDTQFGIYEDCGEEMIYCDGNSGDGLFAALYLGCDDLEPGTTYLLQVDGWAGDEGTCLLTLEYLACGTDIFGCTDSTAVNYNPLATFDDGSCEYVVPCEAYFEVEYIDSLNGIVYIVDYSVGTDLGYFWNFGDGNTSTEHYPEHEYAQDGTYLVCLTVFSVTDNGIYCEDTYCDTITYTSFGFLPGPFWINVVPEGTTVGIDDNNEINDLSLYPNPSSDFLNIEFVSSITGNFTFEVLDMSGRIVGQENFTVFGGLIRESIDLSNFESGTYVLRINTGKSSSTKRFSIVR